MFERSWYGAVALVIASRLVAGAAEAPPQVVFVCEHGSAKSLLALSIFEREAKRQGLELRAVSRGTAPDASVPPAVVEWLRGDGFDVKSFEPRALKAADVASATRVVAIGVDLGPLAAEAGARLEKWDDIPPLGASYPKARDAMAAHVASLLRELARRDAPKR